jgi:uncharacterized circularly permuted ATP-grasp superfamily protein/uncharacterized alpha-E superfamily protein
MQVTIARLGDLEYARPDDTFDEMIGANGRPRAGWAEFWKRLGTLGQMGWEKRRNESRRWLTRGRLRPGQSLHGSREFDPWPVLLTEADWGWLDRALRQRARLLDQVLEDLYGPQELLYDGLIPPELVYANPAWLRACHGLPPASRLLFYAVDLVREVDGSWRIVGDSTQSPAGFGEVLENRLLTSRLFPELFQEQVVVPLAPFFSRLRKTLTRLSPRGSENPTTVLLSEGAAAFEDAYLAQYLGVSLVDCDDLTVRGSSVYLKLLEGLRPVEIIVRRVPDSRCDPLELRFKGTAGIPGLVQTVRSGNVVVSNSLGSGWLETPGLSAWLEQICPKILGEEAMLRWSDTGQPGSTAAFWSGHRLQCLPCRYRFFVCSDGQDFVTLPGGRVESTAGEPLSKDLWWIPTDRYSDEHGGGANLSTRPPTVWNGAEVTSRSAENFFWMGRYLERLDWLVRLTRVCLEMLIEVPYEMGQKASRALLAKHAAFIGVELSSEERILGWATRNGKADSLGGLLQVLLELGLRLSERISPDGVGILSRLRELAAEPLRHDELHRRLDEIHLGLSAVTMHISEGMERSYAFSFVELGRRIERASQALAGLRSWVRCAEDPEASEVASALLQLSDCHLLYRRRYGLDVTSLGLVELYLLDENNPRSVAFQLVQLQHNLQSLPPRPSRSGRTTEQLRVLRALTDLRMFAPTLDDPQLELAKLGPLVAQLRSDCEAVSEGLSSAYFIHLSISQQRPAWSTDHGA